MVYLLIKAHEPILMIQMLIVVIQLLKLLSLCTISAIAVCQKHRGQKVLLLKLYEYINFRGWIFPPIFTF